MGLLLDTSLGCPFPCVIHIKVCVIQDAWEVEVKCSEKVSRKMKKVMNVYKMCIFRF